MAILANCFDQSAYLPTSPRLGRLIASANKTEEVPAQTMRSQADHPSKVTIANSKKDRYRTHRPTYAFSYSALRTFGSTASGVDLNKCNEVSSRFCPRRVVVVIRELFDGG